ncbi:Ig-like domain repeat protein [Compostimonas suwonensis]|uniref:alpha-amylase n=1 Tax=Compostimonas suwonensis TaxID=1048394 RepID=A0A2M9BC99_9MICO|nr:Ig-like domain repeat protein [Compostimonas suwonensis]PJJ55542.1 carboxypeptidase family protein [Compostimonas suwonensis]
MIRRVSAVVVAVLIATLGLAPAVASASPVHPDSATRAAGSPVGSASAPNSVHLRLLEPAGYVAPEHSDDYTLEGVSVRLLPADGEGAGADGPIVAQTDADGELLLTDIEPGSYELTVGDVADSELIGGSYAPDGSLGDPTRAEDIGTIVVGHDPVGLDLVLRRGGTMAGLILDSAGAPIAGAIVRGNYDSESTSDESGAVLLRGLRPGSIRLTLSSPAGSDAIGGIWQGEGLGGGAWETAALVTIAADGSTTPSNFTARLAVGRSISGVIADASGIPVAGVSVSSDNPGTPAVTTGADGSYTLHALPPGSYRVRATSTERFQLGGYLRADGTIVDDYYTARNVIVAAASVEGIDGRLGSGGAVVGHIDLTAATSGYISVVATMQGSGTSRYTNANVVTGEFEFPALPAGTWRLTFSASLLVGGGGTGTGLAIGAQTVVVQAEAVTEVDVVAEAGGAIAGSVRLPDGYTGSVSGSVRVTPANEPFVGGVYGSIAPDGTFTVTSLESGDYDVTVQITGLPAARVSGVTVARGQTTKLDPIALTLGLSLEIIVHDGLGAPLSGASISLYRFGSSESAFGTSGEDGRVTITGLSPGSYQYSTSLGGYVGGFGTVELAEGPNGPLDIGMEQAATIVVTTTSNGVPFGGAQVSLERLDDNGGVLSSIIVTDSRGTSVVTMTPGRYRLAYVGSASSSWAGTPRSEIVVADAGVSTPLTLDISGSRTISGIVATDDGTPLEFATVRLYLVDEDGNRLGETAETSGADGSYTFGPLIDGRYLLSADYWVSGTSFEYFYDDAESLDEASVIALDDEHPAATVNPVFSLSYGLTTISGTVTGPNGAPLVDVEVQYAQIPEGGDYPDYSTTTRTGWDGSYSFTAVRSDRSPRIVFATNPDSVYTPQVFSRTLDIGQGPIVLDAQLEIGEVITGTIRGGTPDDPDGDSQMVPVDGATVYASDFVPGAAQRYAYTDADGRYTVAGLAPGRATDLSIQPDYQGYHFPRQLSSVSSGTSADAVLRLGGRIDGSLGYPSGDRYVEVGVDSVTGGSSVGWGFNPQRPGELYSVGPLEPGRYVVHFSSPYSSDLLADDYYDGSFTRSGATEVVVEAGRSTSGIDTELEPGATIGGTVAAGGVPLGDASVELIVDGESLGGTTSDVNGDYSFPNVLPSDAAVTIRALWDGQPIGPDETVTLSAGQNVHDIDAAAESVRTVIRGTVVDADTGARSWGSITAIDRGTGSRSFGQITDGVFAFVNLPDGDYRLFVGAAGDHLGGYLAEAGGLLTRGDEGARIVTVVGGETYLDGLEGATEPAADISGTLTNADGSEPAAGAFVTLRSAGASDDDELDRTFADEAGRYSFGQLRAGDYEVVVGLPGEGLYPQQILPVTTLGIGASRTVDAALHRYGSATIRVVDVDGTAVQGASVHAYAGTSSEGPSGHCDGDLCSVTGYTDENGSVSFEALLPRDYDVIVDRGFSGGDYITTEFGSETGDALAVALDGHGDVERTLSRYTSIEFSASFADPLEEDDVVTLTLYRGGVDGEVAYERDWDAMNGAFGDVVGGIEPGDYTVQISATDYRTIYLTGAGTSSDPADAVPLVVRGDGVPLAVSAELSRDWVESTTAITTAPSLQYGEASTVEVEVTADRDRDPGHGEVLLVIDGEERESTALADGYVSFALPADLSVGGHSVVARYSGSGDIRPSESEAAVVDVARAASGLTVTNPGVVEYGGEGALVEVNVASVTGVPVNGTVEIGLEPQSDEDMNEEVWEQTVELVDGFAQVTAPNDLAVDLYDVVARYSGSETVLDAEGRGSLYVVPATTTVTLTATPGEIDYDDTLSFDASVDADGLSVTGTVTVTSDDGTLAAVAINEEAHGIAHFELDGSAIGVGVRDLLVRYDGSDTLSPSTATRTVTIIGAPSQTTLSLSSAQAEYGADISATVVVGSEFATAPEGQVELVFDGEHVRTANLVDGSATMAYGAGAGLGSHTIVVRYPGSGALAASESAAQSLEIVRAETSVTVDRPSSTEFGTAAAIGVHVRTAAGYPADGIVRALVDGADASSATLVGGTASIELPADLALGLHSVVIGYDGDANFGGSEADAFSHRVRSGPANVVVTPSATLLTLGTPLGLAVQASSAGTSPLRYTVSYGDGSAPVTGEYQTPLALDHLYAAPGSFAVRVEVTTTEGADTYVAVYTARVTVYVDEPLAASAGDALQVRAGDTAWFDASGSRPSAAIVDYSWDFGDGQAGSGAYPAHGYDAPGSYTARVTVTDVAGATSSAETVVTVVEVPAATGLSVTVRTGGGLLSGAQVSYVRPDGSKLQAATGGDGVATLRGLPEGQSTVYVWADGYVPQTLTATVNGGVGSAEVALASGEIGSSVIEHHRMTVEEIEEADIDLTDPDNTNVFEANINLHFEPVGDEEEPEETPYEVVYTEHFGVYTVVSVGCGDDCGSSGGGGGSGTGGGIGRLASTPVIEVVEGQPVIQWLVIPVRASFLKEMFEVKLVVTNLATGFDFTGGVAELNLPSGLSLASMVGSSQSLTRQVADIAGQSSSSTTWYVRGDTEGSYQLSASYSGVVDPIGVPIRLDSTTAEPLKVWGGSALSMTVTVDPDAVRFGAYRVSLTLTNETSGDDATAVNNLSYELLDRPLDAPAEQAVYVFAPGTALSQWEYSLPAGESVTTDYILYPGLGNEEVDALKLDLEKSFIARTGGSVTIETHLAAHRQSTERGGLSGATVKNPNDPDVFTLSWDRPSGVVSGYTVWTRDTLDSTSSWRVVRNVDAVDSSVDFTAATRGLGRYFTVMTRGGAAPRAVHPLVEGPVSYAALGDSFSSGEGVPDFEPGTDTDREAMGEVTTAAEMWNSLVPSERTNECHRSWQGSYSRILSADPQLDLGPSLYAACSGAVTKDFEEPNPKNDDEVAQLDRLDEFTQYVTFTLGGNDAGFKTMATACLLGETVCGAAGDASVAAGSVEEYFKNTFDLDVVIGQAAAVAKDAYGTGSNGAKCVATAGAAFFSCVQTVRKGIDLFKTVTQDPARIASPSFAFSGELRRRLERIYSEVLDDAPNASVYVATYPHFSTGTGDGVQCMVAPLGPGLSRADRERLNGFVDQINGAIKQARDSVNASHTGSAGITVVDADDSGFFDGKELCVDGERNPDSAFHPLINDVLSWPGAYDSVSFSFHPNAEGQRSYAQAFAQTMKANHRTLVVPVTNEPDTVTTITVDGPMKSITAKAPMGERLLDLKLVDPDGRVYTGFADGATTGTNAGHQYITVPAPVEGEWSVRVALYSSGGDILSRAGRSLAALAGTEVEDASESTRITVDLAEADTIVPVPSATVIATADGYVFDASGSSGAVAYEWWFSDDTRASGAIQTKSFAEGLPVGGVLTVTSADGTTTHSDIRLDGAPVLPLLGYQAPEISGTAAVGQQLAVSDGGWSPRPARVEYQWMRDGHDIDGAIEASYTPVLADGGATLSVRVTVSADGYADTQAVVSGVVVDEIPTTVVLTIGSTQVFGTPFGASARVERGGAVAPEGVATLIDRTDADDEHAIATARVIDGDAVFDTIAPPAGERLLAVRYRSDDESRVATSEAVTVTVARAASAIRAVVGTDPVLLGATASIPVVIEAPGAERGLALGDSVSVDEAGATVATGVVSSLDPPNGGSGVAAVIEVPTGGTDGLGAGAHSLRVSYAGNENLLASSASESVPLFVLVSTSVDSGDVVVDYGTRASVEAEVTSASADYPGPDGGTAVLTSSTGAWAPISGTVVGGSVTLALPLDLATGVYDYLLDYGGDGYYAASRAGGAIEIRAVTPAVELTAPGTLVHGSSASAEVTVTAGGLRPTGTVELRALSGDEPSPTDLVLGIGEVSETGAASIALPALDAGSYGLYAAYRPGTDTRFATATSATTALDVTRAPSSVTVTLDDDSIDYGSPVSGTVTAAALGAAAPGTVTVTLGSQTVTATATAGGWAFGFPAEADLGVGSHTVTAAFVPSSPNVAASSGDATVAVGRLLSHTTIGLDRSTIVVGAAPIRATVTVPEAHAGTLEVSWSGPVDGSATVTLSATGSGSALLPADLPAGSYAVKAVYAGTADVAGSQAGTTLLVQKAAGQLQLVLDQPSVVFGGAGTAGTVSFAESSSGRPSGVVSIEVDGEPFAVLPLGADGRAFAVGGALRPGSHTVTARYAGDDVFGSSEASAVLIVEKAKTSLDVVWPGAQVFGSVSGSVIVTVSAPDVVDENVVDGGFMPSGVVTLLVDGQPVLTSALDAGGATTLALPGGLAGGDHVLVVTYEGSADLAAARAAGSVSVAPASTALVLDAPDEAEYGQPFTLDVSVSSPAGSPSGTVTATDGAGFSVTVPIAGGSAAIAIPAGRAPGVHGFTVDYAGTASFSPATATRTVTVVPVQATVDAHLTGAAGPDALAEIRVRVTAPGLVPGGRVSATSDAAGLGSALLVGGSAVIPIPASLPDGRYSIVVSYAGEEGVLAGTSAPLSFTVDRTGVPGGPGDPGSQPSGATAQRSVAAGASQSIELSGLVPGETVHVYLYSSPIFVGSAVADAEGHATLTFTVPANLVPGEHRIEVRADSGTFSLLFEVTPAAADPDAGGPESGEPTGLGGEGAAGEPAAVPPASAMPGRIGRTGADADGALALAGALLALGAVLALVAYSRRRARKA